MATNEMITKIEELKELEQMQTELKAMIEAIKDENNFQNIKTK